MPRPSVQIASGTRFGRWTVLHRQGRANDGKLLFLCRCACGTEREVLPRTLLKSQSQSCGCLADEKRPFNTRTHGMRRSPEYRVWSHMKGRCCNSNDKAYDRYGSRGIRICNDWRDSFEAFYRDMGPRPSDEHEIDRINNDGHYEPSNCRWLLRPQQASNRRMTRTLTYRGETLTITAWARRTDIPLSTIQNRLKAGCPIDQALSDRPHHGVPHRSVRASGHVQQQIIQDRLDGI